MARTRNKNPLPEKQENLESTVEASPLDEETLEFIKAIDDYRRQNNKPFPTWTEVLTILHSLGYRKAKD